MRALSRIVEYVHMANQVSAEAVISPAAQFAEILRLSRAPGRIGPGDYYSYRLFERSMPFEEKARFVGWRAESLLDALNERSWQCMGLDKVLMYSLFEREGFRIPETRAIYLPGHGRPFSSATMLSTPETLHAWLRTPKNYPFFSKPSASGFGRSALLADRYDAASDSVMIRHGEAIPVEGFETGFKDMERLGYLFQVPLAHDARLAGCLGEIVSSLRMMVLVDDTEGPLLHRCFWKLPTGKNTHDNYNNGVTGNLAAAIDHRTGRIKRVINGTGLGVFEVGHHPDSGVELHTLAVPDWEHVLDFTLRAALTLPKLRFQQWDIALSSEGPVILEANLFGTGGSDLTQLLYRKGLLDETMERFLRRRRINPA